MKRTRDDLSDDDRRYLATDRAVGIGFLVLCTVIGTAEAIGLAVTGSPWRIVALFGLGTPGIGVALLTGLLRWAYGRWPW